MFSTPCQFGFVSEVPNVEGSMILLQFIKNKFRSYLLSSPVLHTFQVYYKMNDT